MTRLLTAVSAVSVMLAMTSGAIAQGQYTIGITNTVQGNGWREQMICGMKAEALASGEVASLNIAHRNTDAAGQLEDIRNLIQAGVDAIVVNPASPDAVNDAVAEATAAGIVVVAVDQAVTEPSAYVMANNQEEYGYLGAKWLFEHLGGKGNVVYMRGIAGASADNDRDVGFKRAMAEYPNIKIAQEVYTLWQRNTAKQQILDLISTGIPLHGVWTSGMDNVIVDAFIESGMAPIPVVGADNAGFVGQLATIKGFEGAAMTNPGSIGGAGVALALRILKGDAPAEKLVLVNPEVWANTDDAGRAKIAAAQNPDLDPEWPVSLSIPGWTTYTTEQIIACKGPGE